MIPRMWLLVGLLSTFAFFYGSTSFAQTITSAQSGDWNQTSTWVGGVIPTSANSTLVTIANGHAITIPNGYNATANSVGFGGPAINASLTIQGGGQLSFNGTFTVGNGPVTRGRVFVSGTLVVQQGATFAGGIATVGRLTINSTGVYRHNYTTTAGTIYTATWTTGSTLEIAGYQINTGAPAGLGQSFSNVLWNTPDLTDDFYLNGSLTTINGNFRIIEPVSGFVVGLTENTNYTLNIGGDFEIASGVFVDLTNAYGGSGNAVVNLTGNLIIGSDDGLGSYGSGSATLNFVSPVSQSLNSSAVLSSPINFSVQSGSTLSIPVGNFLSSEGSFQLQPSSSILLSSTDVNGAIQSGISGGSLRVSGVRTFNSGSSIVYNGASAQFMGNGHPSSAGVNCTISNSSGVSLASNVTVGGVLTLATGNLSISSSTLTLNGSFVPNANSLVVSSASSISIGGSGAFGTLVTTGSSTINNFTINRVSSGTVTLGANLGIGGTFTQTNGNLVLNGRTLTLSGPYSRTNGSLAIDAASSLVIDGTGALPAEIAFTTPQQINSLTLDRSGETLTTSSSFTVTNLNLLSGTFNNAQNITMATGGVLTRTEGGLINNTPQAQTSYDVVYDISLNIVTGSEIPLGADELRNLTKNGAANLTLDQPIIITGNLTVNNGLLISGANSIELQGNFAANSATNLSGSNFIFAGTNSSISGAASLTFDVLTVAVGSTVALNKDINISGNFQNNGTLTPGTRLVTFSGSTTLSGTSVTNLNRVTITGTLTAPASPGSFNVSGNWINNGTFNNNNGTVSFNGTTTISGSSQSNFFHVTIAGSSTLTGSSGIMGIAGNFVNNGTFNANNGTVLFNGTVLAQTVSGSALTFNDITVSNPITPGLQIANTSRLNGTLTLTAGAFFDADGPSGTGVFIVSSTSQTQGGRIAALPNPTNFTGQVTIERFVHGRPGGDYRYLSMPITSGANVGVWRNSIFVTGNFSDRNTNADNANILDGGNTNPSVFTYNSATQTFVGVSGGGGLTTATAVSSRTGYSAYNFNNGDITISYRGTIERGDVPINISGVNGNFNLVPNPYPSQIDWDNVVKTNVNNAMYLRVDNNVFSSYVGGIATNPPFGGWTGEISTGQSFWVVSNGGGATLTLREADKTGNSNYFLLTAQNADDYFRIALSKEGGMRDEIVLRFADNASDAFDPEFDARKLTNFSLGDPTSVAEPKPFFNLASYLAGRDESFSINTVGRLNSVKIVNLSISDVEAGEYKLDFSEMYLLKSGYNVVLVDTYENREYDVTDGFQYSFTVTKNKMTFGRDRFHLRINGESARETTSTDFAISAYPNPTSDVVYVNLSGRAVRELSEISVSTAMGVDLMRRAPTETEKSDGQLQLDLSDRPAGMYLLTLNLNGQRQVVKVIKK